MNSLSDRIRKWVGVGPIGLMGDWLLLFGFVVFLELADIYDEILEDGELFFAWLVLLPLLVIFGVIWVRRIVFGIGDRK